MQIDIKKDFKKVNFNVTYDKLIPIILKKEKSCLLKNGAIAVYTGERTARSPKDRYIVENAFTIDSVEWNESNHKIGKATFDEIANDIMTYLKDKEVFVFDGYAGMDMTDMFKVRIISDLASQAMFVDNMFENAPDFGENFAPSFTIVAAPNLKLDAKKYNLNSEVGILIDFAQKTILIAGSGYTCEIKKGIFSVFNFLAPRAYVLGMHCSANSDENGKNSALFFGLSGTGKTTLSSDSTRWLVGDDQHGWNSNGIYNIENGSYAKIIDIDPKNEAMIYDAIRDGAMIENVVIKNGEPDYADRSITENIRAVIPMRNFHNVIESGKCEHPKTIFFLSADAEGVLPPISKLTKDQIRKYFLCGYTSKIGGTETGIITPEPTFSSGFGAPFLPLYTSVYADLLLQKIEEQNIDVYLINTGWYARPYDGKNNRIPLKVTRQLVRMAIAGEFKSAKLKRQDSTNLNYPSAVEGIDPKILDPEIAWADKQLYKDKLENLARQIDFYFERQDFSNPRK